MRRASLFNESSDLKSKASFIGFGKPRQILLHLIHLWSVVSARRRLVCTYSSRVHAGQGSTAIAALSGAQFALFNLSDLKGPEIGTCQLQVGAAAGR